MANNRMFLVHKGTGKHVMLAKHFATAWYIKDPDAIDTFFNEVQSKFKGNLSFGPTDFELKFESTEDGTREI